MYNLSNPDTFREAAVLAASCLRFYHRYFKTAFRVCCPGGAGESCRYFADFNCPASAKEHL